MPSENEKKEGASLDTKSKNPLTTKTLYSKPDDIKIHPILEQELELIAKKNAPRSFIISMGCLGYIGGEIRTVFDFIEKIKNNQTLSRVDLIFLVIFVIAFTVSIVTGIYSLMGRSDIKGILGKIKSRKTFEISEDN